MSGFSRRIFRGNAGAKNLSVRRLPWSDEGPAGPYEPFLTGFLDDARGDSSGRPAGLIVGSDGALYVSDDKAGAIYRVSYAAQ